MSYLSALKESRRSSLLYCLTIYVVALAAAVAVGSLLGRSTLVVRVAAGDLAATAVVFLASIAADNSSVYDPYWSAAPVPIALAWLLAGRGALASVDLRAVVMLLLAALWAGRLTLNWARGWRGLSHEDWRYNDYRTRTPRLYWGVSFLGFHLFPTILVFLGCLSLYPVLVDHSTRFGALGLLAVAVTSAAIWIEARADRELFAHRSNPDNRGRLLETGVWKYSRHPNYFGEVSFWWGLYLAALSANPSYWWVVVGPASITGLFVLISVPMMEGHMADKHPEIDDLRVGRSALIPWFRRSSGD